MQLYTSLQYGINGFTKTTATKAKELVDQLENDEIVTFEAAKMRLKEIIQEDDERRKQEKKEKEDQRMKRAAKRVKIREFPPEKLRATSETLDKLLFEGSETYTDISGKSKQKFLEALEIINVNNNMKTCDEVVTIKYMYAR